MQLLACALIGQEQTSTKINSVFTNAELYLNTSAILNFPAFCTYQKQGVKLSYKSYKILYFWNCPIKSYIFSKCPINPIFSTKTAIFVNSFKHFQGIGYGSQLYVRGIASLHLMYHPVHAE